MSNLNDTVDHVKTELMPDFDYELYERRQAEWEEKLASGEITRDHNPESTPTTETTETATEDAPATTNESAPKEDVDEDLSW